MMRMSDLFVGALHVGHFDELDGFEDLFML